MNEFLSESYRINLEMERNEVIQIQNEVRCKSEDLRRNLKDMYDWQSDIKEKEKQLKKEKQENEVRIFNSNYPFFPSSGL